MQASMERRGSEVRVPLDLWVRLNHEDFSEPFEADGVDLSHGGLALRSEFLPEVGDRLSCRFDTPLEGGSVEIDGEVVWAHDAGERSGQFGLRFHELEPGIEDDLRRLVEHLSSEEENGAARLHLDGVGSPIDGRIIESGAAWIRVEQELPFLQIGMGVSVDGPVGPPRGTLASVELCIKDGTPRLLLGVTAERTSPNTLDESDVSTVEGLSAHAPATRDDGTLGGAATVSAADMTLQDYELPPVLREDEAAIEEALIREVEALLESEAAPPEQPPEDSLDEDLFRAVADGHRETAQVFDIDGMADDEELYADESHDDIQEAVEQESAAPLAHRLRQGLMTGVSKGRELWSTRAKPMMVTLGTALVTFFRAMIERGGPRAKRAGVMLASVAKRLWAKVSPKGKRGRKSKKRRTTAPAPRRVAGGPRRRQQAEPVEVPPKKRRCIVMISVAAFVGVAGIVYGFSGSDEAEQAPTPIPTAQAAPPPVYPTAPQLAAPAPALDPAPATVATAAPAPAPEAAAINPEEGDLAPAAPEAEAAPAPEGGRLGEPSYPTLSDATSRADGPVSEGQRFGAASVENGRSATIRMSQPVATIAGQAREDGFTITVPGALALDRAGPIAAANPSVDRAMILNRGDHSILTVRFVTGRTPEYQVVARGRAIEVTIGR